MSRRAEPDRLDCRGLARRWAIGVRCIMEEYGDAFSFGCFVFVFGG